MKSMKVLFLTTSHNKLGDTNEKTGVWLEELATPYYVFKEAGATLTIATPLGGRVPLDPKSQAIILATRNTKRFLKDTEAMEFLAHSVLLTALNVADFDVVFLPGGHGTMWDLAGNTIVKQLLETFNNGNKPIGAVSHGVVSLLALLNEKGEHLVKGKQLTCLSNNEEGLSGLVRVVPFLLETKLILLGALYSKGVDYVGYVVADGNIITGQNAASSEEVANKIVALVNQNSFKIPHYKGSLQN